MPEASRQYGKSIDQIRLDHVNRYKFASELVSGDVLDAACGVGYGSRILHDAGCRVTGIDIDEKAIAAAKKYYPGPQYICCDVRDCFLGTFDAVVSFETLEHVEKPEVAINYFRGCAKNLVASVPNEEHYPFVAKNFKWDDYPHFRHYRPHEFEKLLTSCGWNVMSKHCQKGKHAPVVEGTDGMFIIFVCS
jgi:2-polyprenyl-3-methyl-5-hydroxy-6-metoxy-1,4-benzoquinol methylase